MASGRRLYLAYGSNLSRAQMAQRCPGAQPVAAVAIGGWQLGFFGEETKRWGKGGVATLIPATAPTLMDYSFGSSGQFTPAALYLLDLNEEQLLDQFEGFPDFYTKRNDFAQFTSVNGREPDDIVFAYLKNDLSLPNPPSPLYLDTIAQGYRDWGFGSHIDRLMLAASRSRGI